MSNERARPEQAADWRPLSSEERDRLGDELASTRRWLTVWMVLAVPATLAGVTLALGGLWALFFTGDMQAFVLSVVVFAICMAPAYFALSHRDKARDLSNILEQSPSA